jgi:hypothetical protein
MKRVLAAMTAALLMVSLAAGSAFAVKPAQFTTTLTVNNAVATGSYNGGFFVPTSLAAVPAQITLGITGTATSLTLTTGLTDYPFYLKAGTAQQAALVSYFAAKNWTDPTWYTQINAEIAGTLPFMYLTCPTGVASCYIFDGFKYALFNAPLPLVIDNDYPTGTYLYTSVLNGLNVQVKIKVYRV